MGFAANMQVTAQAVPVSGGTITPNGIKFSAVDVTYTVAPKAGWTLASVLIDGVAAAGPQIVDATHYKVGFVSGTQHTIKANYAQTLYNITTTAGSGGSIQVTGGGSFNIAPGATRGYVVAPGTGSQIASLTVDGSPVPAAVGSAVAVSGSFLAISGNHTVNATFSTIVVPTVVDAGFDQNMAALTTNLAGSANVSPVAWTYTGPVGAVFGDATAGHTTFTALTAGTYIVTLTANSVSDSATIVLGAAANNTCSTCHAGTIQVTANVDCTKCHNNNIQSHGLTILTSCIACHDTAVKHTRAGVNDNQGVRAITTEFAKWSHHVTGVNLQDAHCAACHLEGMVQVNAVGPNTIVTNPVYHMADANTHLRNADTDADFPWNPAAPNHTNMDNFCMSCHDANGATSPQSAAIRALMVPAAGKVASASNPFGDTISNRYDKMQRPAVTNVDSQFDVTNNSHHAVKGKRYTGRTRLAGARQIASPLTFANNSSQTLQGARSTIYDAGNLNQLYTPLENAGGETNAALLAGRTGSLPLGDDSTLHCGDCHTVGQWKVGSSETANGSPTPVAIGAHGSNNEYLLRNSIGTDERHTQNAFLQGNITGTVLNPVTGLPLANGEIYTTNPNGAFLVCYNCHSYSKYGSIYLGTGLNGGSSVSPGQPHAGEYDAQGRCNGIGNTLPFNGYTTGTATDGTQFASRFMGPVTKYSSTVGAPVGEQNPDFGNIFGIQCLNCHNSGIGNAYGGIHGSANNTEWNNGTTVITPNASVTGGAYIDGMGNTTKVERFLPGLGNVMHTPGTLGGITGGSVVPVNTAIGPNYTYTTGGISNDTNWEQKHWQQTATMVINNTTGVVTNAVSAGAGCYTLGATQALPANIIKSDVASGLEGPSVTGQGGAATEAGDTWGGCDDHTAGQAKGNHGFLKRIVRPVTY
jgi:hypothetical protein